LPTIPPLSYMVRHSRNNNSRQSSHTTNLAKLPKSVNSYVWCPRNCTLQSCEPRMN
jgi:hypothetical protein